MMNNMYYIACCLIITIDNLIYIGETGRTIGSRIKEHIRMKKLTVFMHLKTHILNPPIG